MRFLLLLISVLCLACVLSPNRTHAQGNARPVKIPAGPPPGGGPHGDGSGSSSTDPWIFVVCGIALGFFSIGSTLGGGVILGGLFRQRETDKPPKIVQIIGGLVVGAAPIALACYFIPTGPCYLCSGFAGLGVVAGLGLLFEHGGEFS